MKYFLLLFILLTNFSNSFSQQNSSINETLGRISKKLNSSKTISYNYTRELNYPSNNFHNISAWSCYYDFSSNTNLLGFKYQIENKDFKEIYNGTESFELDKNNKTFELFELPEKDIFKTKSYFCNSIVTFREIIPTIVKDKQIMKKMSDTLINKTSYGIITLNIGKRRIQYLGNGFDEMQTSYNFIYKIIFDKKDFMIKEIVQTNDMNRDSIKTIFNKIEIDRKKTLENTWFYSTYKANYKNNSGEKTYNSLQIGTKAPLWKLKLHNKDQIIDLNDLKGKIVVLDFWIKNCSACISNVSKINELHEKFKSKDFKLLSINSYDSAENIDWFCKKYNVKYPVLIDGKTIIKKYGITAFPSIVIVDRDGKIIYVDYENSKNTELDSFIKNALEKK